MSGRIQCQWGEQGVDKPFVPKMGDRQYVCDTILRASRRRIHDCGGSQPAWWPPAGDSSGWHMLSCRIRSSAWAMKLGTAAAWRNSSETVGT